MCGDHKRQICADFDFQQKPNKKPNKLRHEFGGSPQDGK